jgi:hypothetical protein
MFRHRSEPLFTQCVGRKTGMGGRERWHWRPLRGSPHEKSRVPKCSGKARSSAELSKKRHFRVRVLSPQPRSQISVGQFGRLLRAALQAERATQSGATHGVLSALVRARRAKVFPPSPDRPAEACCEVSSPRAPVVLGVAFLGRGVRPAGQAECVGGLEVDDQLELDRLNDRQVGRLAGRIPLGGGQLR